MLVQSLERERADRKLVAWLQNDLRNPLLAHERAIGRVVVAEHQGSVDLFQTAMVATDQRMGHGKVSVLTPSERGRKFESDLLAIGLPTDNNKLGFHRSV